ncbi:MAG TPA: hypothetical protein ENH01_03120 [Nitrospirae bacterium]|nr:hypothetical protein [Nitrospirota bacterium]
MTALENKDYLGAGLNASAMVGEQVLTVLTLGEGKAAQQCISKAQQMIDPLLYKTTVISRKTLGADGATSEIIKKINRLTGRTEEVIHRVIKDGKIIHKDIKYRR